MVATAGPSAPTWESLARYQVPEWFRDAKFGIWAHWGPQCQTLRRGPGQSNDFSFVREA
jgi:alpha-L-fucosidase